MVRQVWCRKNGSPWSTTRHKSLEGRKDGGWGGLCFVVREMFSRLVKHVGGQEKEKERVEENERMREEGKRGWEKEQRGNNKEKSRS